MNDELTPRMKQEEPSSELVTDVVPNRSSICRGDTTMYLLIDGSTELRSKVLFAVLNFAIVNPSVPLSVIACPPGSAVEVPPDTPVKLFLLLLR